MAYIFQIVLNYFRYACESRAAKPSPLKWLPTTPEEIKAFVGVCIAMGIIKLPAIADYFSTEPILSHPWFPSILSKDRFNQINRYFHICNELFYPNDKLGKVRNLLDHCAKTFPKMWNLHKNISIDEQLLGSRNRIGFIQYMPNKPARFGIKIWVLADSEQPYVTDFQVYTGKDDRTPEYGLANRVVNDLMTNHINKGHVLFTDNFYSNPTQFLKLEKQGTYAVGTVRQDRKGMPAELKTKNEKKYDPGKSVFLKSGNLTTVRWKDKRDVFVISTVHGNGVSEEFPHKPEMIQSYNFNMNGVDRNDQLLSYYTLNRSTRKWWKKVFWRSLELMIVNSFIIYSFQSANAVNHKKFRLQLAYSLVQPLLNARVQGEICMGPGRPPLPGKRLQGKHFSLGVSKGSERGRCKVCGTQKSVSGKRKDTKTANRCEMCPGKPFLCRGNCFKLFHTVSNLKLAQNEQ